MTRRSTTPWLVPALIGSAAALGASALFAVVSAREAERRTPPIGDFMTVDGVRLHYIVRGHGQPLVLIHGNGTMIQDFLVSGIVDELAKRYRVIVFDRPGYGYSSRPRGLWTPRAHATLYEKALERLGVSKAVVLGHSWGSLVAVSLALQAPGLVRSLVLASGYYYPTLRADVILASPPAIPGIGNTAVVFCMIWASTFGIARIVEQNLVSLDPGVIEAARAMGASRMRIVRTVVLPEALGPLILGFTFVIISLVDMSAMAGIIGGGGVGNFAIVEGYNRFRPEVTWLAVIVVIVFVQALQLIGNGIARKVMRR